MKKQIHIIALMLFVCSGPASAQWFITSKVGTMDVSFENDEVDTAPSNAGISIGYQFSSLLSGLSAEFDITRTVSYGTVNDSDLGVDTQGIYLSYRFGKPVYIKARLGLMDAALTGNLAEDEVGETYGLGIGWQHQRFGVELDYTSIDDDVSYASIGLLYWF